MPIDELAVDVGAEIASMADAEPVVEPVVDVTSAAVPELDDGGIEVPDSSFWDNDDDEPVELVSDIDGEPTSNVSSSDGEQTITYKANGEDVTVGLDEVVKKLSLADGARKAFSDRAKLRKRYDQKDAELKEAKKYQDSWNKLEAIKDDPSRLYEVLSGSSFEDAISAEVERRNLYSQATDEEKRMLDFEAERDALRSERERERADRQREKDQIETDKFNMDKTNLQGKLEREFAGIDIPANDPRIAQKVKKMIWRDSLAQLKEYNTQGYKINDKAIRKAFRESAATINAMYGNEVDSRVKENTDRKKADAKEKAQLASTRSYSGGISSELAKLDPKSLFDRIRKGR